MKINYDCFYLLFVFLAAGDSVCLSVLGSFPNRTIFLSHVHDEVSELTEQHPLQRFSEEVSHHVTGGAIGHTQFILVDTVSDEKISHIDVSYDTHR